MESWLIPAAPVTVVEEIKKSRFITLLAHTDGVEAAKAFVESVRAEHPDARHHCVAWVAGAPDDSQQLGFSDDGEPAGTAGKPMLAQLMGSGVGEITAVVVRYYGGILLGTSGLIVAYREAAAEAINNGTILECHQQATVTFTFPYLGMNDVMKLVKRDNLKVTEQEFDNLCKMTIQANLDDIPALKQKIADIDGTSLLD